MYKIMSFWSNPYEKIQSNLIDFVMLHSIFILNKCSYTSYILHLILTLLFSILRHYF